MNWATFGHVYIRMRAVLYNSVHNWCYCVEIHHIVYYYIQNRYVTSRFSEPTFHRKLLKALISHYPNATLLNCAMMLSNEGERMGTPFALIWREASSSSKSFLPSLIHTLKSIKRLIFYKSEKAVPACTWYYILLGTYLISQIFQILFQIWTIAL